MNDRTATRVRTSYVCTSYKSYINYIRIENKPTLSRSTVQLKTVVKDIVLTCLELVVSSMAVDVLYYIYGNNWSGTEELAELFAS